MLFRGKVREDRNLEQSTVHACLAPHLVMMSETQQPSICWLSPTNVLLLANDCHELGLPGASLGIDVGDAVTRHLLFLINKRLLANLALHLVMMSEKQKTMHLLFSPTNVLLFALLIW